MPAPPPAGAGLGQGHKSQGQHRRGWQRRQLQKDCSQVGSCFRVSEHSPRWLEVISESLEIQKSGSVHRDLREGQGFDLDLVRPPAQYGPDPGPSTPLSRARSGGPHPAVQCTLSSCRMRPAAPQRLLESPQVPSWGLPREQQGLGASPGWVKEPGLWGRYHATLGTLRGDVPTGK